MTPRKDCRVLKGHRAKPICRQMRFRTLNPTPSSCAAACTGVHVLTYCQKRPYDTDDTFFWQNFAQCTHLHCSSMCNKVLKFACIGTSKRPCSCSDSKVMWSTGRRFRPAFLGTTEVGTLGCLGLRKWILSKELLIRLKSWQSCLKASLLWRHFILLACSYLTRHL